MMINSDAWLPQGMTTQTVELLDVGSLFLVPPTPEDIETGPQRPWFRSVASEARCFT